MFASTTATSSKNDFLVLTYCRELIHAVFVRKVTTKIKFWKDQLFTRSRY